VPDAARDRRSRWHAVKRFVGAPGEDRDVQPMDDCQRMPGGLLATSVAERSAKSAGHRMGRQDRGAVARRSPAWCRCYATYGGGDTLPVDSIRD
jgi:hypothetical protein